MSSPGEHLLEDLEGETDLQIYMQDLQIWASKYEIVATVGYLSLLLSFGKAVHRILKTGNFKVLPPPSVIAGLIGLIISNVLSSISGFMQVEIELSMKTIESNLISFVFVSLVFGFSATGRDATSWKRTFSAIWHEGLPMLLYSQVLIWGNSCFALLICAIYRLASSNVSRFEGALVVLGLEAGRDILPSRVKFDNAAISIVHLADSVGLILSIFVGIILVSFRRVSRNGKEWFGANKDTSLANMTPVMIREGFKRNLGIQMPITSGKYKYSELDRSGDTDDINHEDDLNNFVSARNIEPSARNERFFEEAALGSHIGMIALAVFAGYIINLCLKYIEMKDEFLRVHHMLSGIRLFKVCMIGAIIMMIAIRKNTTLKFKSDWFHRLAGFFLDIMAVAALASVTWEHALDIQNVEMVIVIILGTIIWNLIMFFSFAKKMFPNYWYARGVTLMGDALGHSWVGLMFARSLDPDLRTPVPLAYTYKLMFFFVPGSGGKNTLVIGLIDVFGEWFTLLFCAGMVWFWMYVFERYYKERFVKELQTKKNAYGDNATDNNTSRSGEVELELLSGRKDEEDFPCILGEGSNILGDIQIRKLASALPESESLKNWKRIYNLTSDGANLSTLLYNCSRHRANNLLIVIEDSWGYVFGGYVCGALKDSPNYYGNGESFVFRFHPEFSVYRWTGQNEYFILSNQDTFAMGGGVGFSFQLDEELDSGISSPCETFGSPQLSSRDIFKCMSLEVWTFEVDLMNSSSMSATGVMTV